jgi:hypothetical protein
MHAIHATRRTCEVNPNASSFTEVRQTLSVIAAFGCPFYNIETNILSMGRVADAGSPSGPAFICTSLPLPAPGSIWSSADLPCSPINRSSAAFIGAPPL